MPQLNHLLALRLQIPEGLEEDASLGMILGVYDMLVSSGISTMSGEIYLQRGHDVRALFSNAEECADSAVRLRMSLQSLPQLSDGSHLQPAMLLHALDPGLGDDATRDGMMELEEILAQTPPGALILTEPVFEALDGYEPFGGKITVAGKYVRSRDGSTMTLYRVDPV